MGSRTSLAAGCWKTSSEFCPWVAVRFLIAKAGKFRPFSRWLQKLGEVDQHEMDQVFNMGIGLVLCVSEFYAESVVQQLTECGETGFIIGRIEAGERGSAWAGVILSVSRVIAAALA